MKSVHRPDGSTAGLDIIWFKRQPPAITECRFSYEYCRKTSRRLCCRDLEAVSWIDVEADSPAAALLAPLAGDQVLLVLQPETVLAPVAVDHLRRSLADHGAVVPVYNGAVNPGQAVTLPASYLNLATYLEVASLVAARQPPGAAELDSRDLSCVMLSRDLLASLCEPGMAAGDLRQRLAGLPVRVDRGALVHVFGSYYSGQRPELVELVPAAAARILDVGCARGGFGALLRRQRPGLDITGVEMNPEMAAAAAPHYDRVFAARVEEVVFPRRFDHINCGDIIEHLADPWEMLRTFHGLLVPGGTLVVSLPNAGHWTMVRDLVRGDFPYLPVGLQCVTHVRWFTEATIREALEEAGFTIDVLQREQVPPTPAGVRFIDDLCRRGHGDRVSLLTNQLTIRAVRS